MNLELMAMWFFYLIIGAEVLINNLKLYDVALHKGGSALTWKIGCHIPSLLIQDGPQICMLCIHGGCFTYVLQAVENNVTKMYIAKNTIYGENFKLQLCMCA